MSSDPRPDSEPSSSSTGIGMPFEIGSVIAGKYRVDRILGAGGMGVIFAGHHTALDQRVAIKVLKPSAIDNAEFVARFGREARAAARLRSEHVARVLDVGETDKGIPFMVMEYLSGRDLSRVVKEGGPLSVEDACEYVLQACEGLAEAHAAGIVHRDLKPANLFLTKGTDGTALVKVLDFGISKILSTPGDDSAPSEGLTQTQAMIGSPHYMSPEQLKSAKDVDARTDIWSLGGVLFKLLTNEPAFEGQSTPELCVSILVGPLRSMREIRPEIPEELEAIVGKCLSKDPNDRFGTVSDLARAVSRFAPAHTRSSVERIARVTTNPRLRFGGGSDPPPRQQSSPSLPSSGKMPAAVSADAGTVDVKLEMTTLTSSASSMPNDGGPSQSRSASMALPLESNKRPWMLAGVGVVVLAFVAGGVIFTMKGPGPAPGTNTANAPPESAVTAPAVSVPASATATTTAPAPTNETTPVATAPPAAPSASIAKTPPKPGVPPKAPPAPVKAPPAKPSAATPATPPPAPPATTPGMPDFGGRK